MCLIRGLKKVVRERQTSRWVLGPPGDHLKGRGCSEPAMHSRAGQQPPMLDGQKNISGLGASDLGGEAEGAGIVHR